MDRDEIGIETLRRPMTIRIETPRWGVVKRRADGRIDYVSPLPCPFNYGSVPGVIAPDGDPLDAVVLGPRVRGGAEVRHRAWAWVDFVDGGDADPKLICGERPPSARDQARVIAFFRAYARLKGLLNRMRGIREPTAYRGWRTLESWHDAATREDSSRA